MAFRLFGRASRKIIAVADVGSGSAAFAVLQLSKNGPAIVRAAQRVTIPIESRKPEATIAAIMEALETVGQKVIAASAQKQGATPEHPESLMCVIRAPWTNSQAVRESVHFEKETLITAALIRDLAKKTLAGAKEIEQSHILNAGVARVELNGYPTGKPEGKRAHDITVTSLISDCDPNVRTAIEASLEKIAPHTPRVLRSGSSALLAVLRTYAAAQDYVVVNVGGEGTSMTVVREGAPTEHHHVLEGIYTILRKVSDKGLPEETLSRMRMLTRDESTDASSNELLSSLARIEPDLVKTFGEAMSKSATVRKLPTTLFLVTHPDMGPWLSKFFSRIDFTQFTSTSQPFSVQLLTPLDLKAWVVAPHALPIDPGLATAAALVSIEEHD